MRDPRRRGDERKERESRAPRRDPTLLTEDSPLREKNHPAQTAVYEKTEVERLVMGDAELPATVLRHPAVYGPGDRKHRLFWIALRWMFDGRPAILLDTGIARHRFSHGYAENLALGVVLAVTNDRALAASITSPRRRRCPGRNGSGRSGRSPAGTGRSSRFRWIVSQSICGIRRISVSSGTSTRPGSDRSWATTRWYRSRKGSGERSPGSGRTHRRWMRHGPPSMRRRTWC